MNKFFKISLASALVFGGFLMIASAQDQVSPRGQMSQEKIIFPIAELGNCASQIECRAYCNKTENIDACTAFASAHNLITPAQKEQNQKFSSALKEGGPGGCKGPDECKSYCSDSSHTDECVAFAQKHNLLPKENLDRAKKINQTLKTSGGPGGCKSENECKTFCSTEENRQTCSDFAKANGLVSNDDSAKLEKFNELVQSGQTPGGCADKNACESYCREQEHRQECADFAAKLGIIKSEIAEKIKNGDGITGPGGCDSKDACESYCGQAEHKDECLQFAKEHGLKRPENLPNPQGQKIGGEHSTSSTNSVSDGSRVKQCLQEKLGADGLAKLQDPASRNSEQVQAALKACGYNIPKPLPKPNSQPQTRPDSTAIKQCLQEKLGTDNFDKFTQGDDSARQQFAQALQTCGYKTQPPRPLGSENDFPPKLPPPDVKGAYTETPWWWRGLLGLFGNLGK